MGSDRSMCHNLNTWDVFWTNQGQMRQNIVGRRRVGGGLQVPLGLGFAAECARVLHETLLVALLMCGIETLIWKEEEEGFRIRVVQMDNLRGLLGIRRMDKVKNTWIREFCGLTEGGRKDR